LDKAMKRSLLIALGALALAACASAPTHYQPAASPGAVGFSEMRIEPGRYRVTFRSGPGAPPTQAEDYALLRAADLALAEGYDWFQVTDHALHSVVGGGPYLSFGVGGATFGPHSAAGVGVSSGTDLSGGPALEVTLGVVMGKGPKPDNPTIYDARGVRRTVGPRAG
jgi:hypothetical protein